MLYSKSAEYGIQAMIYLAVKKSPEPTLISEIAESYNIPQPFLAKIIQTLVKFNFLKAIRGRHGGIMLARDPKEIHIEHIIEAIDGPEPDEEICVIGLDPCSSTQPCPFHNKWTRIRSEINYMLNAENLDDLAAKVQIKHENMLKEKAAHSRH